MNPFMHPFKLFIAFIAVMTVTSCTNYGKKLKVEGTKGEVYYKGEGVTEAEAAATGKFLKEQNFFMADDKTRSVQISRKNNRIEARFVIDEKGIAQVNNPDGAFAELGALMSKNVFNNVPVDIIYTDNKFADKKTIAYKPEEAVHENPVAEQLKDMSRKDFNNNTMYFSHTITEEEADTLFEYLKRTEFFIPDGNNDLIVNKTGGDGVHLKFPVKTSFANEEGYKKIDAFAQQLKNEMFARFPLQFDVIDENMNLLKTFVY